MKKLLFFIFAFVSLCSCKDQHDIYKSYEIVNGISYPGKAFSPLFYSGFKRGEISFAINPDPSIKEARIYWNNYTDSVVIPIDKNTDMVKYVMDPLEEGSYSFNIRTFNFHNQGSIPVEVIGRVYGDNFLKTLLNRTPIRALNDLDNYVLNIEWAGKASYEVKCVIEYVNKSDEIQQQEVPIDEMKTTVEGYKSGLKVKSFFLPGGSIDTLSIMPSSPKITQSVLLKTIETGLDKSSGVTRIKVTDRGNYVQLENTANDPYIWTLPLKEPLNIAMYYKVYFKFEYQASPEIIDGELYYGRPNAAGGVSSGQNLVFEGGDLDASNESKWKSFKFDCSHPINSFSWGNVGHRFRFDYVQNGIAIMYIRNMHFEIYTLQEI